MPQQKTCPFKLCVASSKEELCKESECRLWSTGAAECYFVIGMQSTSSLVFSIKELTEHITYNSPEKK